LDTIIENFESDLDGILVLEWKKIVDIMLQMHRANSSQKWRFKLQIVKMKKSDLKKILLQELSYCYDQNECMMSVI
jgi:hypothetical protein